MKILPNCKKCYYGGTFISSENLASCKAPNPTEPTVRKFDELFRRERHFVIRRNWDDECKCDNFTPRLSEIEGDFTLEPSITFETSFNCPFCGERIDVYDIGIEETKLVTCDECDKQIAVIGKAI